MLGLLPFDDSIFLRIGVARVWIKGLPRPPIVYGKASFDSIGDKPKLIYFFQIENINLERWVFSCRAGRPKTLLARQGLRKKRPCDAKNAYFRRVPDSACQFCNLEPIVEQDPKNWSLSLSPSLSLSLSLLPPGLIFFPILIRSWANKKLLTRKITKIFIIRAL